MRSHLLEGVVRHRRVAAVRLRARARRLLRRARSRRARRRRPRRRGSSAGTGANVLEFRDADHLDPPAADLRAAFLDHLRAAGRGPDGWQITLVTNLRVLGYVFNPASFYLCRDGAGELRVVVVEVHNTHGERHLYTLRGRRRTAPAFVASMDKDFYVSPFIEMRRPLHGPGPRRSRRACGSPSTTSSATGSLLHASLDLGRRPLTDRIGRCGCSLRHPLVTHKTIADDPLARAAAVAARGPVPSPSRGRPDDRPDRRRSAVRRLAGSILERLAWRVAPGRAPSGSGSAG